MRAAVAEAAAALAAARATLTVRRTRRNAGAADAARAHTAVGLGETGLSGAPAAAGQPSGVANRRAAVRIDVAEVAVGCARADGGVRVAHAVAALRARGASRRSRGQARRHVDANAAVTNSVATVLVQPRAWAAEIRTTADVRRVAAPPRAAIVERLRAWSAVRRAVRRDARA